MMSIPGVESARRRRASYGRSAALEPHVRLAKPAVAVTSGTLEGDCSHGRAMAARHRLDEKLRTFAPCRSSKGSGSSESPAHVQVGSSAVIMASSPSTESGWWQLNASCEGRGERCCRDDGDDDGVLREERVEVAVGGGQQEECPVCLESFVSGQMVISLACHHTFHSTCLVPWLLSHCHCPLCRAYVHTPPF